ncbi:wall-associated receptor kinase 3-like [Prunus dulcis]|nr:wall-associated receptor kinase 3-like [Prunus dulcis]
MNSPGNYSCSCNKGFKNQDPRTCVTHSAADNTSKKVLFAVVGSFSFLLAVVVSLMHYMKRRKVNKLKKEYFERNGGLYLQNQLKRYNGHVDTPRLFTDKELQNATNNYHEDRIIGEGTYGIVYKGILEDEKVVAIKQSKLPTSPGQSNQLVHEVIVVAQINHKNVVKLLGCCLETQRPSLVYEYVSNCTLYDHIHKKGGRFRPLSLALRLKIASETAQALSYLHYSSRTPIIHRDVKAMNILLDENYVAKVSDFGASKLVPEDQNQVSTLVQGTMGYLDPEYLQSNTLTEKSDVYSFGVVLAELLTSQKALSFQKPEAERNLANLFVSLVEQGRLDPILDAEIAMEGKFEKVDKVVDLANRCLSLRGVERPSMKQVAMELEEIISKGRHPAAGKANYFTSPKDTDHLLGSPVYIVDLEGNDGGSSGIITSADYDKSLRTQIQMNKHYDNGR